MESRSCCSIDGFDEVICLFLDVCERRRRETEFSPKAKKVRDRI